MSKRGRRNSRDLRRTRQWLLDRFGDGAIVPCYYCERELSIGTLTLDRIIPGKYGGTYSRFNVRPACAPCNVKRGAPFPSAWL